MVNWKNILCSRASLYVGGATFALGTGVSMVLKGTFTEAAIKSSMLFGQYCQQIGSSQIIPQLGNITCQALDDSVGYQDLVSLFLWTAANAGIGLTAFSLHQAWNFRPLKARITDLVGT